MDCRLSKRLEKSDLSLRNKKITNHSNHSIAVIYLVNTNVPEQQLIKITERSNLTSIKPYLNLQQNRHEELMNTI